MVITKTIGDESGVSLNIDGNYSKYSVSANSFPSFFDPLRMTVPVTEMRNPRQRGPHARAPHRERADWRMGYGLRSATVPRCLSGSGNIHNNVILCKM